MSAYICIAKFQPKPGMEEALEARLMELVRYTRQEPGCMDYDLCHNKNGPFMFYVIECYKSKADFVAHSNQAYLKKFIADLDSLVFSASVSVAENVHSL